MWWFEGKFNSRAVKQRSIGKDFNIPSLYTLCDLTLVFLFMYQLKRSVPKTQNEFLVIGWIISRLQDMVIDMSQRWIWTKVKLIEGFTPEYNSSSVIHEFDDYKIAPGLVWNKFMLKQTQMSWCLGFWVITHPSCIKRLNWDFKN